MFFNPESVRSAYDERRDDVAIVDDAIACAEMDQSDSYSLRLCEIVTDQGAQDEQMIRIAPRLGILQSEARKLAGDGFLSEEIDRRLEKQCELLTSELGIDGVTFSTEWDQSLFLVAVIPMEEVQ